MFTKTLLTITKIPKPAKTFFKVTKIDTKYTFQQIYYNNQHNFYHTCD